MRAPRWTATTLGQLFPLLMQRSHDDAAALGVNQPCIAAAARSLLLVLSSHRVDANRRPAALLRDEPGHGSAYDRASGVAPIAVSRASESTPLCPILPMQIPDGACSIRCPQNH